MVTDLVHVRFSEPAAVYHLLLGNTLGVAREKEEPPVPIHPKGKTRDPRAVELKGSVRVLNARGLPCLPLAARFRDPASGREYTLVNAHLDSIAATEQMKELYRLAKQLPMPVVLLGCFGEPVTPASDLSVRKLENGYSHDDAQSNPDFAAFLGLPPEQVGAAKETETAIRRRTSRRRERPSHDIITVELLD